MDFQKWANANTAGSITEKVCECKGNEKNVLQSDNVLSVEIIANLPLRYIGALGPPSEPPYAMT